jgi:hypothetical protein
MTDNDFPQGMRVLTLPVHRDARGTLVPLDRDTLPFEPARTFVISGVPPGATRGGRALACTEFMFAAAGTCRVTVSDGVRRCSIALDHPNGVLAIAGLVVELSDFTSDAVVIVLSPKAFADVGHRE